MRKHEQTDSVTWPQYVKQMKQVIRDLERFGLNLGDKAVAIAMIEGTELEASTKLHIESVAGNSHPTHDLSTNNVEESLRRLIMDDKEQKVLEVVEVKQTEEDKQSENTGDEALWVRSSRFHRGARNRRYQGGNRGANANNNGQRGLIRGSRGGFRRPHNRCFTCNSDKHYAVYCDAEQSQFTGLVSQTNASVTRDDSFETSACTHVMNSKHVNLIIDTGASKTVVGQRTLNKNTEDWSEQEKDQLFKSAKKDDATKFKFGDRRQVKADNVILMPLKIQGRTIRLKTFVLPGEVPFLLGVEAMRLMRGKTNIETNTIELMENKLQYDVNEAGHFVLGLKVELDQERHMHVLHMENETEIFKNEKKVIYKLHHQFGHAKPHKLCRLIEHSSSFKDMTKIKINAIVKSIIAECEVCQDSAERDRRRKNSTIRAIEFNECVAIDLTEWWDETGKEKI